MVVEIKADVENARAIANDMDSYGESVSESAGRCGQEAYSRDTAFGEEFMRSASAYTRLLQGTGANIGEAMSGFSQRVCSAARIFEQAEEKQRVKNPTYTRLLRRTRAMRRLSRCCH